MAASPIIGVQDPRTQDSRPGLFRSLSKRLVRRSSSAKSSKKSLINPTERSSHPVGGRILTLRALPPLPPDDEDGDTHDLVLRHTGTRVAYEDARRKVVPKCSHRGSEEESSSNISTDEHDLATNSNWFSPGTASSYPNRGSATKTTIPSSTITHISILEDTLTTTANKSRRRWSRSAPQPPCPVPTSTTARPLSEPLTLRDVLMKRIVASQTRRRHKDQYSPGSSGSRTNDSRDPIERPLTPVQTRELLHAMHNTFKHALEVPVSRLPAICAVCSEPSYIPATSNQDDVATEDSTTAYISSIASQCPSFLDHESNSILPGDLSVEPGRMACCGQPVCRECLSRTILQGIQRDWFRDIQHREPGWIPCPVEACDAIISLYRVNVRQVLEALGIRNVGQIAGQFVAAEELRRALRGMVPPPTEREIRKGVKFHRELVRMGCAWSFLDGDIREVEIKRVTVDFARENGMGTTERLHIPMFTHLLKLLRLVKECSICAETYHDLQVPDLQGSAIGSTDENEEMQSQGSWTAAITKFPGDWTRQISTFPSRDLLPICAKAHPDTHVCRPCLAKHIDTQVELHGHATVPSSNTEQERGIACPVGKCQGRKFSHQEISDLARPETFARYDRLCVLNSISTDPGFRWCLRRGCQSGAIYEAVDSAKAASLPLPRTHDHRENSMTARQLPTLPPQPPPRKSSRTFSRNAQPVITTARTTASTTQRPQTSTITRITCPDCSFTMCFDCQTPWHTSLTCHESRLLLESSLTNPSALVQHTQTQTWLAQHTKRCPNPTCSAPIEKGDGCFHMTCSACQFQFCWECLADWRGVVVDGRFVREGHGEGCYFRGRNAVPPTQIMGVSVERGLRRTRGLFR